eukprot:EG_transcript_2394
MPPDMSKVNVFDTGNFRTINLVDDVKKPLDDLSPEASDTKRKREKKPSSKRLTHSASYRVQGVVEEDLSWIDTAPQDAPAPNRKQRSQNRTAGNRESPSLDPPKPSPTEEELIPHAERLFNTANARTTIMHQYQNVQHKLVRETYDRERMAGGVSSAPQPMLRHISQQPSAAEARPSHPVEGMSLQEYVLGQRHTAPQEGVPARPANRARPSRSNDATTAICPPKIIDNRPATRQKLPTESLDLFLPGRPGAQKDDLDSESDDDGLRKVGADVANFGCLFVARDDEFGDEPEFPSKSAGGAFRVSQVDWDEAIVQDKAGVAGGGEGKEAGVGRKKSGKRSAQKERVKDRRNRPQIAVIHQERQCFGPCEDVYIDESSQGNLDPRVVDEWLHSSFEAIEDPGTHDLDNDHDDGDQAASLYDLLVSQKPLTSKPPSSGHLPRQATPGAPEEAASPLARGTPTAADTSKSFKKSKKRDSGDQGGPSSSARIASAPRAKDRGITLPPDTDLTRSLPTGMPGRTASLDLPPEAAVHAVSPDEAMLDRLISRRKPDTGEPGGLDAREFGAVGNGREVRVSPVAPHDVVEPPGPPAPLLRPMSSAGARRPRDGAEGRVQNLPKNLDLDEVAADGRRRSGGILSPEVAARPGHDGFRPLQPDLGPAPAGAELKRPMSSKGARPGGSASLRHGPDSKLRAVGGDVAAPPAEARPRRAPSFPDELDNRRSGPKGYTGVGDEPRDTARPPSGLRSDEAKARELAAKVLAGEGKAATADAESRRTKVLPIADAPPERWMERPDTSSGQSRRQAKEPRTAADPTL